MNTHKTITGETLSTWMDVEPFYPTVFSREYSCDVCVIGAGIAGLSAAYMLAKEGRSVVVYDMGPVAGGQTGRTTAHLTFVIDDHFQNLIKYYGVEGTAL